MKLSIIIPIYKVEAYLAECVESVLGQTFKDYEILLVDDGSPDNCPKLCDDYVAKYDCIKALHKPNGGLSDARNFGLKQAQGDYVLFLDSDDYYLHDDFLQTIVNATENGKKDAVFFQRTVYFEGADNAIKNLPPYQEDWMSLRGDDLFYALSSHDRMDASACMKVTKRSILVDNKLFFKKGIYCEDIEWFSRYLPYINDAAIVNKPDYCYRKRIGSITTSLKDKNVYDLFYTIETHAAEIRDSRMSVVKKNALLNYLSYQYYIVLGLSTFVGMHGMKKLKFMHKCRRYSWISRYSVSPKTRKSAKLFNLAGAYLTSYVLGYYIKNKNNG